METLEHNGLRIEIFADEGESPREWDNIGTMVCFHNRYELGDKHDITVGQCSKKIKQNNVISLPLYLYDHSGITMSTSPFSCHWDSGQVGYIMVTKEEVRKQFGWKQVTKKRIEKIKSYLRGEVETYDQYLTGDVYCYIAYDSDNNQVDGCGGFYGTDWENNGLFDTLPGMSPNVDKI